MPIATTPTLHISYAEHGPASGYPLMLLHGWPDSPATWDGVVPHLAAAGYRVIVPTLRGYGATRHLDPARPRSGQPTALARDALELADALGLGRFALIGHDWGGRAVFPAAIIGAERLDGIVSLSVPWAPSHAPAVLSLEQAQAFWYQWFLCSQQGEAAYRLDFAAFEKRMWDTWSPAGWYEAAAWAEVAATAAANPDHVETVLHFYRSRWGLTVPDPACAEDEARVAAARAIGVPTLVIHGGRDTCTLPSITEGMASHFTAGFERAVIAAGHFPQREAAQDTAGRLIAWLCTGLRTV
ncbi:MAG: alpha/beta hydrolase [Hyphomicrobiaceae bacterium]